MAHKISRKRFLAWKCMELAGILHNKKRRLFLEELERRANDNAANIEYSEIILRAAQRMYPENRQMRKKDIRARLKEWEKRAYYEH